MEEKRDRRGMYVEIQKGGRQSKRTTTKRRRTGQKDESKN
jgi:hypothetical protein